MEKVNNNSKRRPNDSIGWGIEEPNKNIRIAAYNYLHSLGLQTPLFYSLPLKDLKTGDSISLYGMENNEALRNIFSQECGYSISLEPSSVGIDKKQIDDVKTINDLYNFVAENASGIEDKYNISFVEFIQRTDDSFTGTAISNGKGKLLIEVLMGETDIRKVTRKGGDPTRLESVYYSDFNTCASKMPTQLPAKHLEELEKMYHYHPGFFKYIYGSSRGQTRIWSIFSSRNPMYIKTLKYSMPFAEAGSNIDTIENIEADMRRRIVRNSLTPRAPFDDLDDGR